MITLCKLDALIQTRRPKVQTLSDRTKKSSKPHPKSWLLMTPSGYRLVNIPALSHTKKN